MPQHKSLSHHHLSRRWNGNTASQRVNTRRNLNLYKHIHSLTHSSYMRHIQMRNVHTLIPSTSTQTYRIHSLHYQHTNTLTSRTHSRHTWLLRSRNTEKEQKKKQQKHQLQANRVSEFSSMRITLNAIIIREIFMVLKTSFTSFHVR